MTDRELLEDIVRRLVKIEGYLGVIPEIRHVRSLAESYQTFLADAKDRGATRSPLDR